LRETEGFLWERGAFGGFSQHDWNKPPPLALEDAVGRATAQLSRDLRVRAIVVYTASGWTAGKVSAGRPQAPILSATPGRGPRRRTTLFWGVETVPVVTLDQGPNQEITRKLALESGLAEEGHYLLVVRGFHQNPEQNLPSITVCRI
jgi:pyruvate kinase